MKLIAGSILTDKYVLKFFINVISSTLTTGELCIYLECLGDDIYF